MERILKLIYGYVVVLIGGEQLERFLNLCRNRNIYMEKVCFPDTGQIKARIQAADFKRLRSIRSKTGVHIQIIQKRGLPFFFFRNKKRKAFFAGMLLGCILIFFMTGRIWNIHIEGNVRNSTGEILTFLKEEGIVHGMAVKKADCSEIAAAVRRNFAEITWVSARIEGTRLYIEIQEDVSQKETMPETSPCDLTADKEGVIMEMIVRAGVPVKKPGDICRKGDILVSGELHIMNDSQEIVRKEYVHADADIYVSRQLSYYHEFPLKHQIRIFGDRIQKGRYIRLGSWYLGLYRNAKPDQTGITTEYQLRITENFLLPVWIGRTRVKDYKIREQIYTQKEAKQEASYRLQLFEKELLQNGAEITEARVTTAVKTQSCITSGILQITEQTGKETSINTDIAEKTTGSENEG